MSLDNDNEHLARLQWLEDTQEKARVKTEESLARVQELRRLCREKLCPELPGCVECPFKTEKTVLEQCLVLFLEPGKPNKKS